MSRDVVNFSKLRSAPLRSLAPSPGALIGPRGVTHRMEMPLEATTRRWRPPAPQLSPFQNGLDVASHSGGGLCAGSEAKSSGRNSRSCVRSSTYDCGPWSRSNTAAHSVWMSSLRPFVRDILVTVRFHAPHNMRMAAATSTAFDARWWATSARSLKKQPVWLIFIRTRRQVSRWASHSQRTETTIPNDQ